MTPTALAEIAVEQQPRDWASDVAGPREYGPFYTHRPSGVRLDNDGCQDYWIAPGHRWTLRFDGTGWRAENPAWRGDHVYRLADSSRPKGTFIGWLPTAAGGRIDLEPGLVYELGFDSIDDTSDAPQLSRSALMLCIASRDE